MTSLPEEISKEVIERLKAEMEIQLEKLREDKDRELKSLRDDINQELFKLQRDRDAKLDQKVNTTENMLTVQIQQSERNVKKAVEDIIKDEVKGAIRAMKGNFCKSIYNYKVD